MISVDQRRLAFPDFCLGIEISSCQPSSSSVRQNYWCSIIPLSPIPLSSFAESWAEVPSEATFSHEGQSNAEDWDLFVPNFSVESSVGSDHGWHGFSRMNWIRIRAVRGWGLRSRTAPEWCRAGARRRAAVASRSGRAQIGVCDTSPRIHNWITTWICLNRKERKERRVKDQWDQCTPCFLSLRPLRSLRLNNAG